MQEHHHRRRHHHHKEPEETIEENVTNPWTDRPYSENYKTILKQRRKLPVYEFKEEVISTVQNNKVTIIEGSTGSGKTTQIPQFLLESNIISNDKKVLCTQPRRVAAINVATRVAQEMDVSLGSIVGYSVRFDSRVSENTRLIYMTDGLLMKEFILDPQIRQYGIVIIDEAHERNINSDIILGLLKQLTEIRADLHVVVMSATLEAQKFTNFFGGAPHLIVPGRLYPVDIIYTQEPVSDYVESAITYAIKIHRDEPSGDILIFLTGEEEIETACQRIREGTRNINSKSKMSTLVLPLYASLPPREQQLVFLPPKHDNIRKIIVSTNIAETSVTIDGVVYVIDPGFVKQSQYQPDRRMFALLVTPISQAAANQRSGRAGRTRPGKCYRLYTESSYNNQLEKQTIPEIQRTDLSSVILTMLATGIKDIIHFPFIDAPPQTQLAVAIQELYHLGAINNNAELTEIGNLMAVLPVEPKHAKSLIASKKFGCTNEMSTLIAILSEQGQIFLRPRDKVTKADAAHSQFKKWLWRSYFIN
ncbi:P-loop containing nucleoside triphosphate hydrolase protein [Histomonas meleagridis]|uniref:P-loop containing nucleoside triphosphate hydrolase protein n=1 Tax=Histomonas meleagridis TaxID=135588 RepID=UPI00355A133B|nr:P-loop containing nucleoside triphosphate hydrolase protein [Histomonas meleagridis]